MQSDLLVEPEAPQKPAHRMLQRLTESKTWDMGFALGAIITLTLSLLLNSPKDPTQDIVQEVVRNHLKLKPLDINTSSINKARGYFTQLEFSPINSSILDKQFFIAANQLIGGRYCSIKGITAAQFRYSTSPETTMDNKRITTLYQVGYDPNVHGEMPDTANGDTPVQLES